MKRPQPIIRVILIVAVTIIALTLILQRSVCEIHYRNGSQEVVALLDCKSVKSQ
ncbi:Hok/Gef family protein [Enterobacteriaceae bacterium RIT691]|nr:Hok/Gef family protein [Enterobacteriaceae bacterium RIT691]